MSNENPLSTQMQALITYANETTGEADTDLSAAVDHLAAGYGGGSNEQEDALVMRTLTSYTNDRVTKFGTSAFQQSTVLTSISSTSVTELGENCFYACYYLVDVKTPNVETIGRFCFCYCHRGLKRLDFSKVKTINAGAFMSCNVLTALIIRTEDQVCSYGTTAAAQDPPNASLKIYVPSALVDSYKAADNWSRLADHFAALEDYTVDGTTTGAMNTDESGNIIARTQEA